MQAFGLIETRGLLAAIESADAMLKAAEVTLLEKTHVGGGLVTIVVTGGVAAVQAAVEAGSAAVKQIGEDLLVSQHVIPRPHEEINDLIITKKAAANEVIQNTQSVGTETIVETEALEEDVLSEEADISDEVESTDIVSEVCKAVDYLEEAKEVFQNVDEINKESIDKLVLEYGFEKAIQVLSKLKVSKLRNLARKYLSMGIKGREISKADKKMIIAEFKEYYRKNQ